MAILFRGSVLISAVLLAVLVSVVLPAPAHARIVNRVVATIDGQPVTLYQYEEYVRHNTGGMKADQLSQEQKEEALDGLITDSLITMQAEKLGLHVSSNDVEAYIQQIMVANDLDEATLTAALEQQGLDAQGYRSQIRRELLKNQLVSRDIRQRVNISDEQVARYYEEHSGEFAIPAAVDLSHILLIPPRNPTPDDLKALGERARRAHMRLVSGESFEKVAREMSDAPDADDGGHLGRIEKGQMMPEIENVAFVLPKGEVSHPVQSGVGLHILKVNERETADAVPLDQIRDQIKERLYAEAIQERFNSWADADLREGHSIETRI